MKSEDSVIRYFERETTFTYFIAVCYDCFHLLFVVTVNLLLCLMYQLNFIIGYSYMYRKESMHRAQDRARWQASTGGVLHVSATGKGD